MEALCVSKLLVLLKGPILVKTSNTSFIESFPLSSRTIVYIYYTQTMFESLDNVWFTLPCYKIIRVDYNQFDRHFCFFNYMCLRWKAKKQSLMKIETIFPSLHTRFKNRICNWRWWINDTFTDVAFFNGK